MNLKLTLTGAATPTGTVDVEIDAPPGATVGALAAALAARSPHHHSSATTLAVRRGDVSGPPLDPHSDIQSAAVSSGATVDLIGSTAGLTPGTDDEVAGVAAVITGPDTGARFPLRLGSNVAGRDRGCDVVLNDALASRRHIRIDVGDHIDVVDLGSVNGMSVDGSPRKQARVDAGTDIMIGDTTLRLSLPARPGASPDAFVRSPPTAVPTADDELVAPVVPTPPKPPRIPVIAALAPFLLGGVMFAMTRRVESLIFIALSPIMLMGNAVESRLSNRKGSKQSAAKFQTELESFAEESARRIEAETAARHLEHPRLNELIEALHTRSPMLWSRRPDGEHFIELCVGRGRQPPRCTFTTKPNDDASPELQSRLDAIMQTLQELDDVPIVADLVEHRSIGIAGPPGHARPLAASMVASATLLHSPAELTVMLLSSEAAGRDWDWLKWLPHVDSQYSPLGGHLLASTAGACTALLGGVTQLLESRLAASSAHRDMQHVPAVIVVIEDDAPIERSLLVDLLERGPGAGIHALWVASAVDRLPAGCGVVVDATSGTAAMSMRVRSTKQRTTAIRGDLLAPARLEELARSLSPVVDTGAKVRDDSGLPDVVNGPELLGIAADAAPQVLLDRWAQTSIEAARHNDTGLRAPVGIAGGEPFTVDLRKQGPHALVGGTTGAGKSEFLQSWVMGLATTYSSQRVNFLFVDYKGGAAFSECVKLPHTVGLVTDLSPHLVDRALTSLRAELHRRELLFGELDAKDIHDLERRGDPRTPPVLIIVVDEFAALVQEVPDFVDGVVNVAQRGRSLGLHLVLATQRPAGVITGNLRANTNIRIALRMADESDSSDVIDVPDAAFIDASHPGRGIAKVGPGRTHPFQSSYYGGWSSRSGSDQKLVIRQLEVDPTPPWKAPRSVKPSVEEPNDLAQLVAATKRAALVGEHPPPRRPWLPDLPSALDLRDAVLTRTDERMVFGTADVPSEQAQPPLVFEPDRDGNLAVFGASGSGKSTLLRTLAMVAGSNEQPCQVYGLDFGSRNLQMLDAFAHVGSIITGDDHERIVRLLQMLRSTIDERQDRYQAANADTIAQYRSATKSPDEARVLLLVDNFGAFRQAYDAPDRMAILALADSILADGRSVGVHVVITADRPGAVPSAITSTIPRRLVLRLSNESDYMLVGEPANILTNDTPPGRGIEQGREFQVAVLGGTPNLAERTELARQLAQHEGFNRGHAPAPPVRRLPTRVALAELPDEVDGHPTIGVSDATLEAIGVEPAGPFVVAGPPGSGRTTAMGSLAVSLGRARPDFQRVLFAERRSSLVGVTSWTTVAERSNEYAGLAAAITADLKQAEGDISGLAIFVENVTELLEDADVDGPLQDLIKTALAHDAFVVLEGETSLLTRAWKLDAVKNQRTGLIMQPQTADGDLLKAHFPRFARNEFPPGRAMLVGRRQMAKVHVALPSVDFA